MKDLGQNIDPENNYLTFKLIIILRIFNQVMYLY